MLSLPESASQNLLSQRDLFEVPDEVTYLNCANMAIAALRQILDWGVENIQQSLGVLTQMIAEEAAKLGCAAPPAGARVNHMIGIRAPNGIPVGFGERMAEAKIFVSIRGDAIRVAPHLHNDESDVEKLFKVLRKMI